MSSMADLRGFLNCDIFSSWVSMMTIDFISGGFKLRRRGCEVKTSPATTGGHQYDCVPYGLLRTDQHD